MSLGAAFLSQGPIEGASGLELGLGLDREDIGLLLGFGHLGVGLGAGLVHDLHNVSLHVALGRALLTLNLGNEHVTDLLSLHDGDLLAGDCTHPQLILLNLGPVDL